jgi:hypothetical protein
MLTDEAPIVTLAARVDALESKAGELEGRFVAVDGEQKRLSAELFAIRKMLEERYKL